MEGNMKSKGKILIAFLLNLIFSIVEFLGGIFTGSVAITSDALHDFGDAISIGLSFFLEKISGKKPNEKYTFGYARYSVLGGLITTLVLLASSGIVIYKSIQRIISPVSINYNLMIVIAIVGFFVNLFATFFTHGGKSINQKAVNLHMLEDVLGWLVVLIGAVVMKFTNLHVIDPILSICVAVFIIVNCVKNLIQISNIFLIKTPKDINLADIKAEILKIDGVIDLHHLHVWTLDGEINLLSLHLVVKEYNSHIKNKVKEEMYEHGICHTTIEMEEVSENCKEKSCNIKINENICEHCGHHH
jgi:cobalt-zinc-cadmium efflux system protein